MENQERHKKLKLERIKDDLEKKLIHLENSKKTTNVESKKLSKPKLNYVIYGLIGALFIVVMYQSINFFRTNNNSKLKKEAQIITDNKNKFYTDSLQLIDINYEFLEVQNKIVKDSIKNEELFLEEEILEKDRIRKRFKSKQKKKTTYTSSKYNYDNSFYKTIEFNTDTNFENKPDIEENTTTSTNTVLVAPVSEEEAKSSVPRYNVDKFPVYPGCESKKSQSKIKKCFKSKISKHVTKRLNNQISKTLVKEIGLDKINISIIITKRGTIKILSVDGSKNDILKKETSKAIKSLPKVKPGRSDGQIVVVRYNIPISF